MLPSFRRASLALAACACISAHAQPATPSITVTGNYDKAVGGSDLASQGVIKRELLKSRPALRPARCSSSCPASSSPSIRATASRGVEATLDVFNLFDKRVNDIQYFYESQLPGEAAPVADRHVHPAEPRSARLTLQVRF